MSNVRCPDVRQYILHGFGCLVLDLCFKKLDMQLQLVFSMLEPSPSNAHMSSDRKPAASRCGTQARFAQGAELTFTHAETILYKLHCGGPCGGFGRAREHGPTEDGASERMPSAPPSRQLANRAQIQKSTLWTDHLSDGAMVIAVAVAVPMIMAVAAGANPVEEAPSRQVMLWMPPPDIRFPRPLPWFMFHVFMCGQAA